MSVVNVVANILICVFMNAYDVLVERFNIISDKSRKTHVTKSISHILITQRYTENLEQPEDNEKNRENNTPKVKKPETSNWKL